MTLKERKKYTCNYNVHRQKKWLCPKDGLQTNHYGNSKEGEVYVLLEWGRIWRGFPKEEICELESGLVGLEGGEVISSRSNP